MIKVNAFSIFGILFLSPVLLASGMYSNNAYVLAQQENEAEVEADIEQENKCKKDTECENENEINNSLDIISNGTQTEPTESTLNVIKTLTCIRSNEVFDCPPEVTPDQFTITVTGNNPSPSEFPGSEEGTLVTMGAGAYSVSEDTDLVFSPNVEWSAIFSGDCTQNDDFASEGTIAEGEAQTCTIENQIIVGPA